MRYRQSLSPWQVIADNFMLYFAWAMILMSLMMIFFSIQKKANKDYHPKAEFMVVLDWDDKRKTDLDLWLKAQDGRLVWYNNKEIENISLDRDSRGFISNQSKNPDGTIANSGNEEIITLRAITVGNYNVAVIYFSANTYDPNGNSLAIQAIDPKDIPIDYTLKVFKVNPNLKLIFTQNGHMDAVKQIDKVVSFHISEDGSITIIPNDPDKFLPPDISIP